MNKHLSRVVTGFILACGSLAQPSLAQDPVDNPNADITAATSRHEARAKQYEAEQKEIEAKANRDASRVEALGLPSYEGKTTLKDGAGVLEGTMLSAYALDDAADKVTRGLTGMYLLVAGDEAIDFGLPAALKAEMEAIKVMLVTAIQIVSRATAKQSETEDFATIAAAVSAAAGLLRSDVEVTPFDTDAIADRTFATAVAAKLPGKVIFPTAAVAPTSAQSASGLGLLLNEIANLRLQAESVRATLDAKKEAQVRPAAALDAATKRYDDFFARVTSPDDKGHVPLAQAMRLEQLLGSDRKVLRVRIDKAGEAP